MHGKIENGEQAVRLSRSTRSIIRQNIVISFGIVLLLVRSAPAEKISLTVGVIGHEGRPRHCNPKRTAEFSDRRNAL